MAVVLRARNVLATLRKGSDHESQLALIEFSLKSKKVNFSKVVALIDGMVSVLGNEQKDDDSQKNFCVKDLEKSEKEKADTETAISSSEAAIEEMTQSSADLASEIANLQAEVKELDKA